MATKQAKTKAVVTRYDGDKETAKSFREEIARQIAKDGFVNLILKPTIYVPGAKRYDVIPGRMLRIRAFDVDTVTQALDLIEKAFGV